MTKRDAQQLGKGLAFISPWIVGFLAFMLLPIVLSFYYSLCEYSLSDRDRNPALFIGAANYTDLMRDEVFWKALKNTLYYAAMTIPASLLLSLGLAMLLNVKMPGQTVFRTIIFLPSVVPVVAAAMCWMWMFNSKLGVLNNLLNPILGWLGPKINTALDWTLNPVLGLVSEQQLHMITAGPSWLDDPRWALPALAFMSLWGVGYTVVIYLAGLQDVPRELYEAAEIDGAGLWGRMWNVTIPMLSPVIFFNLIMSIIGVLQVFDIPYIMTPNGGPGDRSTLLLATYLQDNAFRFFKMGYASAIAWILLLVILALTGMAFWSSRRWVHYQGK